MSEEETLGTFVVDSPSTEQNDEDVGEQIPTEDEPLLEEEKEKKKKRKIRKKSIIRNLLYACLALVILIIVTAITTVLIILYGRETKQKPLFGYNDMFDETFKPTTKAFKWSLHDTSNPTMTYWNGGLYSFTPNVAGHQALITSAEMSTIGVKEGDPYTVTMNEKFVVFKTNTEKIWRHSSWGQYVAYDVEKKQRVPNFPVVGKQRNLISCPANDSLVAYVDENNNIFMRDLRSSLGGTQITNDGVTESIFNGVADWVYEEDVLEDFNTLFFSPDCKSLAYVHLDDTGLDIFYDPNYKVGDAFPTYTEIRYPVVGRAIPKASMKVYDLESKTTLPVSLGTSDKSFWIYDVKWTVGNHLAVTVFPRDQRTKNITLAKKVGASYVGSVAKTFTTKTWFPVRKEVCFISETEFLDVLPYGDRYSIFSVDVTTKVASVVAHGDYDVQEIYCEGLGRAPTNGIVTFRAINGLYSVIYRVNVASRAVTSFSDGESFSSGKMDPTGSFYVYYYEGPTYPYQELRKMSSNQNIWSMNDNNDLKDKLSKFELPSVDISQTLSVSGVSKDMDMLIMKPPYFSDSDVYPALINVYGGPSSKTVSGRYVDCYDSFSLYMASQGFVVAMVDGRGTRGKGEGFMTSVYKRLGFLETDDQVSLRGFLGDFNYVDKTKISIWGWSYGGFMTLFGTVQDTSYASAVAVAPDCSHRGYDAAYSERYMGLAYSQGYNRSNILNRVNTDSFKETELFLVHGMSDDNVHPFNSYNLMTKMQEFEIQFDLMMFPNKAHSLQGAHTRKFLFKKIGDFLVANGK